MGEGEPGQQPSQFYIAADKKDPWDDFFNEGEPQTPKTEPKMTAQEIDRRIHHGYSEEQKADMNTDFRDIDRIRNQALAENNAITEVQKTLDQGFTKPEQEPKSLPKRAWEGLFRSITFKGIRERRQLVNEAISDAIEKTHQADREYFNVDWRRAESSDKRHEVVSAETQTGDRIALNYTEDNGIKKKIACNVEFKNPIRMGGLGEGLDGVVKKLYLTFRPDSIMVRVIKQGIRDDEETAFVLQRNEEYLVNSLLNSINYSDYVANLPEEYK